MEQETTVARQELKLTQAGIPHDVWLMADWLERPELHAGYRLAVLTGLNCIDAKRRMLIERLKRSGVKVLATAGAGRCGGADALEGCTVAADAVGFRPARIISLVKEAGGYAPADRPGLEVDTDGAFMSVRCLKPGRWMVRLPFAADVVNLKSGQAERTDGDALTLELDAGTTCWFRLERRR